MFNVCGDFFLIFLFVCKCASTRNIGGCKNEAYGTNRNRSQFEKEGLRDNEDLAQRLAVIYTKH
jgi:hypothetical protein